MKNIFILPFIFIVFLSCKTIDTKKLGSVLDLPSANKELTEHEVIEGLKEALDIGTQKSVSSLSQTGGFWNNSIFRIPIPDKFNTVKEKLIDLGMSSQVNEFHQRINTAAEKASSQAVPIFKNAITGMSIQDAFSILKGTDTSATHYFRTKTQSDLRNAFMPVIKKSMDQAQLTSLYNNLISKYNQIPFVKKFEFSLEDYIADQALSALFTQIAQEEQKIRKDPVARTTDILKRVFGYKK